MRWFTAAALILSPTAVIHAASLNVAPVLLEVMAPSGATVLTLRNGEQQPLNVQVRVFRWEQVDGDDRLTPTRDVVVSPPVAALRAGSEQVIRVVRISKRPVVGEESYRVVVDELPDAAQRRNGRVKILLRYSVPAFFADSTATPPRTSWSLRQQRDGVLLIEAANSGGRRLRIANVAVRDAAGNILGGHPGLLGYVLPGTTMRWSLGRARPIGRAGTANLTAETDAGPLHATAPVRADR